MVTSSKSKRFQKCSKTISEKTPVEKCDNKMKSNLKESKENFESKLS